MTGSAPLRIAFFGSGRFAVPAFEALLKSRDNVVLAVSTTPAKAGRGQTLSPTPIAKMALDHGVSLLETASVNGAETLEIIELAQPELLVVVAFRGFLGQRLIGLGFTPPINIHPSLLPRHRGPAPVNWTLIGGDRVCGVTVCFIDQKIDSGDILAQRSMPTPRGVGAGELEETLSVAGAELMRDVIEDIRNDTLVLRPQDESLANINRLLSKADGRLDFYWPAEKLANLINGLNPWPGARGLLEGRAVGMFGALWQPRCLREAPGTILGLDEKGSMEVATGDGVLKVAVLQPEGRSRMPADAFLRGYRGEHFTGEA